MEHHRIDPLATAHPGDAFTVPAWDGPLHTSAAALLGGAPLRSTRQRSAPLTFPHNVAQRRVS
ncbi:hypothetical protein D1Y84_09800 [Acidipila sp. EB88]|nr:hypothetical protein D1Y84_09800 [Acidipila sp. EB88]